MRRMRYKEILTATNLVANCALSSALKEIERVSNKWGDYVYEHLFVPILKQNRTSTTIRRRVLIIEVGGYSPLKNPFILWFSKSYPTPDFIMLEFSRLGRWVGFDYLVLTDHPIWTELKAELVAADKAYHKAIAQRDEFMAAVEKIVLHYDTIDEAIAAWPAFRFFLPEGMREWHFEGQPKPLPEGIDTAKLTAMVVRFRLTEE